MTDANPQPKPACPPAAPAPRWRLSDRCSIDLDRTHVVAVLNVTPDSFSDGGRLRDPAHIAEVAAAYVETGATLLDIGGESTRPGADRVHAAEQIARVVPAIEAIRAAGIDAPLTIDTTLAEVAKAALDAGADAINDVSAGDESSGHTIALASKRRRGIVLMHRLLAPDADVYSHQYAREPRYAPPADNDNTASPLPTVVAAVRAALLDRAQRAVAAGLDPQSVAIDMGLGFGKSVEQNYALIRYAHAFVATGFPVFAGASRKSFIGKATGVDRPHDRLAGSLAAAAALHHAGVRLIRVHDVAETVQLLRVLEAVDAAS